MTDHSREPSGKAALCTIRCCAVPPLLHPAAATTLTWERLLAVEATRLLMRLDGLLRDARADWNQDRFRRLMRLRAKAVSRLRRRWLYLRPQPPVCLGSLRRRYHANLDSHLSTQTV